MMAVTRHADPHAFLAAAAPIALRCETTFALVNAWVERLVATPPAADERVYLATYATPAASGIAMRRRQNFAVIEDSDAVAAAAFARDIAADWPQLQGVVGTLGACEAFAEEWQAMTGRGHVVRFRLRHHVLSSVTTAEAPGSMRVATADDTDWLVAAEKAFIAETGLPDDPARIRHALPARIEQRQLRVWDDAGAAAYAGWSPAGSGYARIGPVWTAPAKRRCGYATALVAALAAELLANGRRRIFLVTDVANSTSNAIYARVGFRALHDFYHFDFVDR